MWGVYARRYHEGHMIQRLGTAVLTALGLIFAGFLFLGVAWNGAAGVDFVQGQIPYLLSGGAVGLGLIILGASVLLFEAGRRATQRLEERLERLTEVIGAAGLGSGSNGRAAAAAPKEAPSPDAVVIGESSFHRQDCRLVEGKAELVYASLSDARDRGLNACRVCGPLTPDTASRTARRRGGQS